MVETQPARDALHLGGDLWLLGGSVAVDNRLSWRGPEDAGRYDPINVYLAMDGGECLLIEAGVALFAKDVIRQIEDIAGPYAGLSRIAVTRNEPDTVSAMPQLAQRFAIRNIYSPGLMNPLQFFDHVMAHEQMRSFGATQIPAQPGSRIAVGGARVLEVVQTPLRMLSTTWYHDAASGALFCSDLFTDAMHGADDEAVIRNPAGPDGLVPAMRRHLLLRYDWLAYSELSTIIADLRALLARFDIAILAPSRGCPVVGKAAVEERISALLTVLDDLARERAERMQTEVQA